MQPDVELNVAVATADWMSGKPLPLPSSHMPGHTAGPYSLQDARMLSTVRYLFPPDTLEDVLRMLGIHDTPFSGSLRVVYTRAPNAAWTYCAGRCVLGEDASAELNEVYPNFSFISRALEGLTLQNVTGALASDSGLEVAPDFPGVRLAVHHPNWREEIVPSYAMASGMPSRRFRVALGPTATPADVRLIDYELPYRPSAAQQAKAFLRLRAPDELTWGEFTIEVPERRGSIQVSQGHLSITHAAVPLRLVGEVNGSIVDLRNEAMAEIEGKHIRDAEVWLLTSDNELVDYISTTQWPYKYGVDLEDRMADEVLRGLIHRGESEICEFKPYIDLQSEKASELEKTVCAFSNQRGGTLFIGVNKEGDVVGLAREVTRRPDDLEQALIGYEKAVCSRLRETLRDNQCFRSAVRSIAGTRVLVIEVGPSREINYLVSSELAQLAYIRRGATSSKMSPPEIQAKTSGHGSADMQARILSGSTV